MFDPDCEINPDSIVKFDLSELFIELANMAEVLIGGDILDALFNLRLHFLGLLAEPSIVVFGGID